MSCNRCNKKNCNCNKGCSSILVDGNYVYQAWATDTDGGGFSLNPFRTDGSKYPYTAIIISQKKIERLTKDNFKDRWFPTSYNPSGIQVGDNISLLTNDVPYLKNGDDISELNNDEGYLKNGDNISELNNDEGYIKDSQGITDALGYIPEDEANKNQPNGYPTLDENGLVPANQLPQINLSGQIFVYENETEMNASVDNLNGNLAVLTNPTGNSKSYLFFDGVWLPVASYNVSSINGLTGDITGVVFETDLDADNGIIYNNGKFQLGGTLIQDTNIDGNGKDFSIDNVDSIVLTNSPQGNPLIVDKQHILLNDFGISIKGTNGSREGLLQLLANPDTLGRTVVLTDNESVSNQKGFHYQSDYSLVWDASTFSGVLATKGYVDRLILSGITVSNGLTEFGKDIQLGGDLSKDTIINKRNNVFVLNGNGGIYLNSNGGDSPIVQLNTDGNIDISGDSEVDISSNNIIRISNNNVDLTKRGVNYGSDYSINWDATTLASMLATKGYVDRLIQSGITASNGLTDIGGDIQLGGVLTKETTITTNQQLLTFLSNVNESEFSKIQLEEDNIFIEAENTNSGSNRNAYIAVSPYNISQQSRDNLDNKNSGLYISPDDISLISESGVAQSYQRKRIDLNGTTGILIIDQAPQSSGSVIGRGLVGQYDYSPNYTPETYVQKLYVDKKTVQVMSFARNGNVGNGAYLRGSGNIAHNNSFGELVATDVNLDSITYRVNSANDTSGDYLLVLRIYDAQGGLLWDLPLLSPSVFGEVNTINLDSLNFIYGFDGRLSQGQMIAIQFRRNGSSVTTQLNRVQATLKLTNV